MHSALAIGTRIAMLHDGRIIEVRAPRDSSSPGNEFVRSFLDSQYITKRGEWETSIQP